MVYDIQCQGRKNTTTKKAVKEDENGYKEKGLRQG